GDLHMVDVRRVPQRLEQRVRKPQHHQVLHRLLAEIVIDAEYLVLLEYRADLVVELPGRGEAAADGLLDHDARIRRDHAVPREVLGDLAEQGWRNGQVEDADAPAVAQHGLQLVEPRFGLGIDRDIAQPVEELAQFPVIDVFLDVVGDRLFRERAERVVGQLRSRGADDAGLFGKLAGDLAAEKRREELALGKIARSAEHHEVKRVHRDGLAGHGYFPVGSDAITATHIFKSI